MNPLHHLNPFRPKTLQDDLEKELLQAERALGEAKHYEEYYTWQVKLLQTRVNRLKKSLR